MVTTTKGAVEYVRDAISNVIGVTTTEKSDLGRPDVMFFDTYEKEGEERTVRSIDNAGNSVSYGYDAQGFLTWCLGGVGHERRTFHDPDSSSTATARI